MKLLITGGSGLVGQAFKKILPNAEYPTRHEIENRNFKNKNIIHLAAKVGGIKANSDFISDFYVENNVINQRVLFLSKELNAKKVISLMSTCVYPDSKYVTYPLTEEQLHMGPPHYSNFGYAYSKRMLDVLSRTYRQQYGCNFITAIPNNLYGENDNFDLDNGHVIPSLIRKIYEAKINNNNEVEIWGDGSSLREFTYSSDIVKIILFLLENYDEPEPINIGNTEEYSIKGIVNIIIDILEYDGKIFWNTDKPSGQFRKPSSNKKLLDLGWEKENYTPLRDGLKKTCEWVKLNYPNIRGIN